MAECQTHATLNKIHAFLLLPPLLLPDRHVILFQVGMGEISLQIEYQVRTVVLFLDVYFIQRQNKSMHACMHVRMYTHRHTHTRKAS